MGDDELTVEELQAHLDRDQREAAVLSEAAYNLEDVWGAVTTLGSSFTGILTRIADAKTEAYLQAHAAGNRVAMRQRELDRRAGEMSPESM
jgi:hypothetical protein